MARMGEVGLQRHLIIELHDSGVGIRASTGVFVAGANAYASANVRATHLRRLATEIRECRDELSLIGVRRVGLRLEEDDVRDHFGLLGGRRASKRPPGRAFFRGALQDFAFGRSDDHGFGRSLEPVEDHGFFGPVGDHSRFGRSLEPVDDHGFFGPSLDRSDPHGFLGRSVELVPDQGFLGPAGDQDFLGRSAGASDDQGFFGPS